MLGAEVSAWTGSDCVSIGAFSLVVDIRKLKDEETGFESSAFITFSSTTLFTTGSIGFSGERKLNPDEGNTAADFSSSGFGTSSSLIASLVPVLAGAPIKENPDDTPEVVGPPSFGSEAVDVDVSFVVVIDDMKLNPDDAGAAAGTGSGAATDIAGSGATGVDMKENPLAAVVVVGPEVSFSSCFSLVLAGAEAPFISRPPNIFGSCGF